MSNYRIAVNMEWTSRCNARCSMCPRDLIAKPQDMSRATFDQTMERITPADVFRVVVAGYGEPTIHPAFGDFAAACRQHPVRFDLVSNGPMLDETRLRAIDGAFGLLIVSFSSVDPRVYEGVQVGLDCELVKQNLLRARDMLRETVLAISLSPTRGALATLPETVAWLRANGIQALTMSPNFYDRAADREPCDCQAGAPTGDELRAAIAQYGFLDQTHDFIPSAREILLQWQANTYKCVPRNVDMMIAADGSYLYCFNDIRHRAPLGNVAGMSLREAIHKREQMPELGDICGQCNLRGRYDAAETMETLASWQAAQEPVTASA